MDNHLVSQYLYQSKELFGNTLFLENKINDINFYELGDITSEITIIKFHSSHKDEQIIFSKILKALNLSEEKIYILDCLNSNIKKDKKFKSLISQLKSKIIITLGLDISQFLLDSNENLEILRKKRNFFKEINVIPTYSINDIRTNLSLKRNLWNDLKVIL